MRIKESEQKEVQLSHSWRTLDLLGEVKNCLLLHTYTKRALPFEVYMCVIILLIHNTVLIVESPFHKAIVHPKHYAVNKPVRTTQAVHIPGFTIHSHLDSSSHSYIDAQMISSLD